MCRKEVCKKKIIEMHDLAQKRGGKCLSQNYVNRRTHLLWKCEHGHEWSTSPASVLIGHWCPTCAGIQKCTIEEMKSLAESRGGKCLSTTYVSTNEKLEWECSEGHTWLAEPAQIKGSKNRKGTWCPECVGKKPLTLEQMQKIAESRGGKCLSDSYINTDTPLLWECEHGHQWKNRPAKIKKGQWCPKCAGRAKRTLSEMQAFAKSRGGKCLSSIYKNLATPLLWECSKGHQWEARPGNVVPASTGQLESRLTWCPYCAGKIVTRDDLVALAKSRGGDFLSPEYLGGVKNHKWRCYNGHEFSAKPNNVKNGTWCKHCNINYGEEITRIYVETIFDASFPSCYPQFLKDPDSRSSLELDGYNENLKIAFEHQGAQHYRHVKRFHRTHQEFKDQLKRDEFKAALCKEHGVRLLIIPAIPDMTRLEDLPDILWQQCQRLGLDPPNDPREINPDINQIFSISEYDTLKALATSRGGKLLSKAYLGDRIKLSWECSEGHVWEAPPNGIKNGTWCPTCAGTLPTKKKN